MAESTSNSIWLQAAFLSARDEFLGSLTDNIKTKFDFSKLTTIDEVYRAARDIERQQEKTKTMRGLKRIEPLLRVLKEFNGVIDTFVQVKPDIMGLIWGPLKFLLQVASTLTTAFGGIVKILGDVGLVMPSFTQYATLFPQNDDIRRILCLFFEDILSLYALLLNFVTNKRLGAILEPFWPSIRSKVEKIQENIEHHKSLMTVSVTLEDISRAQRARKLALEECERAQKFREQQSFGALRNEMRPVVYHEKLRDILERTSEQSGAWLGKHNDFLKWLDPIDRTARCLWLHGIPGAGKTYLTGNIVRRLQKSGQCTVFAFISHDNQQGGKTFSVLTSLLFQALQQIPSLLQILPSWSDPDHRKLTQDLDFLKKLLGTVLTSIGPTFIILDGLDEVEESATDLISTVLDIMKKCVEVKVLFSCKNVRGIALALGKHATPVRVDENNRGDIKAFVQAETDGLIPELESCGASKEICSQIRTALDSITDKSDGMFLYARLVLHGIRDYRTPQEIKREVENLPNGLDEAYGRIIARIERNLSPKLQEVVRQILKWITCAGRPLREEELLQILVIDIGTDDFTRGPKDYRDIRKDCGPIIEFVGGAVRFAHFSAKEYLLHEQSNCFLKLADAHLQAALACATYLSYSSLDTLFSATGEDLDIRRRVLAGDYVFLEYAALEYMNHIKAWMRTKGQPNSIEEVSTVLHRLFETRRNADFDSSALSESIRSHLDPFEEDHDLRRSIANADFFITGTRVGMIMVDENTGSSVRDPLTIFSALTKFRRHLESIACDGPDHHTDSESCQCQALEKLYGPRLFHCTKPFCSAYYLDGFQTRKSRNQHVECHSSQFRCPELGCLFAGEGFSSKIELSRHMVSAHAILDVPALGAGNGDSLASLPVDDKFLVLQDAIINSQHDEVRHLIREGIVLGIESKWHPILASAAWYSPPDILQWLLTAFTSTTSESSTSEKEMADMRDTALHAAIESQNLPNIKLLLSNGANIMTQASLNTFRGDLPSYEPGIFTFLFGITRALGHWSGELMRFLIEECGVTLPSPWDDNMMGHPSRIFASPHLVGLGLEDLRRRFDAMKPYILWTEAYKYGPDCATNANLPVVLRVCLENGGDPNMESRDTGHGTPLYKAIRAGALHYGEMAEILLEFGADPNLARKNLKTYRPLYAAVRWGNGELVELLLQHGADVTAPMPKDFFGLARVKKVEKYFGAPWHEVVRNHMVRGSGVGGSVDDITPAGKSKEEASSVA
ncbi:hypothetical protein QBC47DRAFT_449676 [Echria macrotheca]|uniref:NACHT domain-containing protein n=1 Tax=Echria macrotheca TaxID=438768 RepID=A0AAJ0FEQ0_9PEZI|nr:hypothetical protein QBC47DRAFT_449676 [Echria macrotheca]